MSRQTLIGLSGYIVLWDGTADGPLLRPAVCGPLHAGNGEAASRAI